MPHNTRAVALSAVIVYSLWALMFGSLITALALIGTTHHRLASAFGLITLVLLGIAAVVTLRCYILRVCGVLRALNGIEPEWNVPGLHTVP